jgi:hypothetical protein
MFNKLKPYTKTVVAFVVAVLQVLSLYVALSADGHLSAEDKQALINAVIVGLGGTGAVYALPNRKARS